MNDHHWQSLRSGGEESMHQTPSTSVKWPPLEGPPLESWSWCDAFESYLVSILINHNWDSSICRTDSAKDFCHCKKQLSRDRNRGQASRRLNGTFWEKCNATKFWNNLPQIVTQQNTHGEFKNEFYNFKINSYKDSTLNFAPTMFA